jgi:hypothetical protein
VPMSRTAQRFRNLRKGAFSNGKSQ